MTDDRHNHPRPRGGRRTNQRGRPRVADPRVGLSLSVRRSVRERWRRLRSEAKAQIVAAVEAAIEEVAE